jgi:predicted P-loop ATPase/GTPase
MEMKVAMDEKEKTEGFDVRFRNPSSFLLGGVSQSGKTTFAFNLLENIGELFEDPRCAQNVIYYYNVWQNSFDVARRKNLVKEWFDKLPTTEEFKTLTMPYAKKGGSVVVFDDFAEDLTVDILKVFTMLCHHTNSVVILMTQNIFSKNRVFRDISLNTNYVVLFKNNRDQTQIVNFARQFAQGRSGDIVDAYYKATDKAFSYLLFDMHNTTPRDIQIRTNVLPGEGYPVVYRRM